MSVLRLVVTEPGRPRRRLPYRTWAAMIELGLIGAGAVGALGVSLMLQAEQPWLQSLAGLSVLGAATFAVVWILRTARHERSSNELILDNLQDEVARLQAELRDARAQLKSEMELRLSLEAQGLADRRRPFVDEEPA